MDNWEDWDSDNYCLPNEEQLKKLYERNLVEESDNALTKNLFEDYLDDKEVNKYQHNTVTGFVIVKKEPKKKTLSKKDAHEQKQKESSKLAKEHKAKKEREKELFGQATENEYAQYEEMFY